MHQKTRSQQQAMNALRGAQNRTAGKIFEQLIEEACYQYREEMIADIDKTPEPTRQLGKMDRMGRFSACYEKRAQPDFKGTVAGGRSVVFEAKYTSTDKMSRDVVLEQQAESLDRHMALGAYCFVLVGFGMNDIYRIPWMVWKTMKQLYGRQYIRAEDVEEFRVESPRGIPDFLNGIRGKEKGE